jgi:hypothetical protein
MGRKGTTEGLRQIAPFDPARTSSDVLGDHGLEMVRGTCRRSVDLKGEVAAELRGRSGDTALPGHLRPELKSRLFPASISSVLRHHHEKFHLMTPRGDWLLSTTEMRTNDSMTQGPSPSHTPTTTATRPAIQP